MIASSPDLPAGDTMTVLRARNGRRMAKTILPSGRTIAYDNARFYDAESWQLSGIGDLWRALGRLIQQPNCCIVRGGLIRGPAAADIRRLVYRDPRTGDDPTLVDVPRRWLALDSDKLLRPSPTSASDLPACADVVLNALPPAFGKASAIVQATAGHGLKPELRLRLWFWCSRPMGGDELCRWLAQAPLDLCVFRPAQPIFTAAPIFAAGLKDHLPRRLAFKAGGGLLDVPSGEALSPPPPPPPAPRTEMPSDTAVRRLIARTLDRVARAAPGERHAQLRAASRTLGGLIEVAGIPRMTVERELLHAVLQAGGTDIDQRNAAATIAWGLDKGAASPLNFGGQRA